MASARSLDGWQVGVLAGLLALAGAAWALTDERMAGKRITSLGTAVLLVVLGLAVAFAPESVPGLTIPAEPDSGMAPAMENGGSMGMGSG